MCDDVYSKHLGTIIGRHGTLSR